MKKKQRGGGGDIPEWVVTYGDLMSLLLCFFILLAAFSELKQPREYRKVLEKIREALGFTGGMGQSPLIDRDTNSVISLLEERARRDDDQRSTEVNNEQNVPGRATRVSVVHEGNYHTVGTTLAFPGGSEALTPQAERTLRGEVAERIRDQRNIVRIVGHAWGSQDLTHRSGSLVDLAFLRARAVHDFLVGECDVDPAILRIESAANTEPAEVPLGAGDGAAQNRRVQVYLTDRTLDQIHPDPYGTGRTSP